MIATPAGALCVASHTIVTGRPSKAPRSVRPNNVRFRGFGVAGVCPGEDCSAPNASEPSRAMMGPPACKREEGGRDWGLFRTDTPGYGCPRTQQQPRKNVGAAAPQSPQRKKGLRGAMRGRAKPTWVSTKHLAYARQARRSNSRAHAQLVPSAARRALSLRRRLVCSNRGRGRAGAFAHTKAQSQKSKPPPSQTRKQGECDKSFPPRNEILWPAHEPRNGEGGTLSGAFRAAKLPVVGCLCCLLLLRQVAWTRRRLLRAYK